MSVPQPKPPATIHPLSRELLESLAGHPEAEEIVIGGGVALSHYLEYRNTVDLDAWWRAEPRADVVVLLEAAMRAIASRHGLEYRRRSWGETESLELLRGTVKQFSFQISRRTVALDDAIPSFWQPVRIETLRDNVASKMTAFGATGRAAGLSRHLSSLHPRSDDHGQLLERLHGEESRHHDQRGKQKILARLAMIETTRPLETIQPVEARDHAARVRDWYYRVFAVPTP